LEACLELEEAIHAWSADTWQSDDIDVARRTLRSMLVDLAGAATHGLADPRTVVGPVVSVALDVRAQARANKDFATSDLIRDRLAEAGVEIRDTPEGQEWDLR
jgi:cysteinyl-tRNA synthetase